MIGVVRPGDTLVIAVSKLMSDADGDRYRESVEKDLLGIRVVLIAPATEMVIYRDGNEPQHVDTARDK